MRRDVFQAIADPTRREILLSLSQNTQNINTLAQKFDMTRQAVSLHVKILEECGVITTRQTGRERYCDLQIEELMKVHDWLKPFKEIWESRFMQLDSVLDELKRKQKGK